ncbi:hypothetical protein LNN38_21510 [Pseudomonas sp. LA21]|uniref:hypothetical protein n=1 Tax=Pseudomonas sp. LA21 TaxID=2893373 RepID=UPI001FB626E7|nr:hypothetical protein [Pseudomonas sp. LA21]MCJ1887452.1 hypothetical protein [Pseudomonas sp. LA21]
MSTYSALNVFKSLSKIIAQQHGRQLSETRERLSLNAGFSCYHDLQNVGLRYCDDARLLRVAFGVEKFADVFFLPEIREELAEQVNQRALQDDLAPKASGIRYHMDNLLVESRYDAEKGILIAHGEADLTRIEQCRYAQQFQWFSATLDFEVKFREQRWRLVCSSISMRLEANDEEGFIEDLVDDFPPTEFWD